MGVCIGGANGKESACQGRRPKRHGFHPWVGKIPWRRAWELTPVFLPGESHAQRSLAGYIQSIGSQRDRHSWSDLACMHAHIHIPWRLSGKESTCRCRTLRFDPWISKTPRRRTCQPAPVVLPGKSQGQRSLVGYSAWDPKSWMWLRD